MITFQTFIEFLLVETEILGQFNQGRVIKSRALSFEEFVMIGPKLAMLVGALVDLVNAVRSGVKWARIVTPYAPDFPRILLQQLFNGRADPFAERTIKIAKFR